MEDGRGQRLAGGRRSSKVGEFLGGGNRSGLKVMERGEMIVVQVKVGTGGGFFEKMGTGVM